MGITAKWGKADFSQLKVLQQRLQKLQNTDIDKFCEDVSKALAARLLSLVIRRTPVGTVPNYANLAEKITGIDGEKITVTGKNKAGEIVSKKRSSVEVLTEAGKMWEGYTGGTLRRGWTAKTHEEAAKGSGNPTAEQALQYAQSLPVEKSGKYFIVRVVNPVKYASYVEFGHRQTPGRYVPALGMRLKNKAVEGKYMLKLSEEQLETAAPKIIEKMLDNKLREVFNVGD